MKLNPKNIIGHELWKNYKLRLHTLWAFPDLRRQNQISRYCNHQRHRLDHTGGCSLSHDVLSVRHTLAKALMEVKLVAYFALCRPLSEYEVEAWDPHLGKRQIITLENV